MFAMEQGPFFCDESSCDSDDTPPLYIDLTVNGEEGDATMEQTLEQTPEYATGGAMTSDLLSDLAVPLSPSGSDDDVGLWKARNTLGGLLGINNDNNYPNGKASTLQDTPREQEGCLLKYVRRRLSMLDDSVGESREGEKRYSLANTTPAQQAIAVESPVTPSSLKTAGRRLQSYFDLTVPRPGLCQMLVENQTPTSHAALHLGPLSRSSIVQENGEHRSFCTSTPYPQGHREMSAPVGMTAPGTFSETETTMPPQGPHVKVSPGKGSLGGIVSKPNSVEPAQPMNAESQTLQLIVERLKHKRLQDKQGSGDSETKSPKMEKGKEDHFNTDVDAMRASYFDPVEASRPCHMTPETPGAGVLNDKRQSPAEIADKCSTGDVSRNLQIQGSPDINNNHESGLSGGYLHMLEDVVNHVPPPSYNQHIANRHSNWPEKPHANYVPQPGQQASFGSPSATIRPTVAQWLAGNPLQKPPVCHPLALWEGPNHVVQPNGFMMPSGMMPYYMHFALPSFKTAFYPPVPLPPVDSTPNGSAKPTPAVKAEQISSSSRETPGQSVPERFPNLSIAIQQNEPEQKVQQPPVHYNDIQNWRHDVGAPELNHQTMQDENVSLTNNAQGQDMNNNFEKDNPKDKLCQLRTAFSYEQIAVLENEFRRDAYLGRMRKIELSQMLNVPAIQVKNWFQNRRMKQKNSSEGLTTSICDDWPMEEMNCFTSEQINYLLEKEFQKNAEINPMESHILSQVLQVPEKHVMAWFQKRHRQEKKRRKLEEKLSDASKDKSDVEHPNKRRNFTQEQKDILENEFQKDSFIQSAAKLELSRRTNLTEKQVTTWFGSRRQKQRKMDERGKAKSMNVMPVKVEDITTAEMEAATQ